MLARTAVLSALATAAAVAVAAPASAQKAKRPKPACGIRLLPLAEGNWWSYETVNQPPGGPAPAPVKIEVVKVETSGKSATITLKESYRGNEYEMTATCSRDGLVLPPASFFFASEPGGIAGMTFTNEQHKGNSYPARGFKSGDQWLEEYKADVTRPAGEGTKAEHAPAKVELERLTTVVPGRALVDTAITTYTATSLEFEILGRGLVGEKSQEIPVRTKGALWFDKKIGIVRAREVTGREWQLVDTNLVAK